MKGVVLQLGLEDRRVVITGASKGIGFACARGFAAEGARVVLVARDRTALTVAADKIRADSNVDVDIHAADLSKEVERSEVAHLFEDADVLVNNAGAIPGADLLTIDLETWRAAWDLRCSATCTCRGSSSV